VVARLADDGGSDPRRGKSCKQVAADQRAPRHNRDENGGVVRTCPLELVKERAIDEGAGSASARATLVWGHG